MPAVTEFFAIIYQTFTPLALIVAATMLVSRRFPLDARTLARINIYLFAPSLVFDSLINSDMSTGEISRVVAATIVCGLLMAVLAAGLARFLGLERRLVGTFATAAVVMNGLNFGIPFIEFAFGSQAIDRAIVFNIGQIFIVYTLGTFLVSRGSLSFASSLGNVFRIPLPYVFVLGVLINLTGYMPPEPAARAVGVLGQATVPCALVILGLQLTHADLRGRWQALTAISITRFGLGAGLAFLVTALFGLTGLTRQVFILQYSMPVGVSSGVLATEFDGDAEFAAAAVFVTTLASVVPLSVLLLLA